MTVNGRDRPSEEKLLNVIRRQDRIRRKKEPRNGLVRPSDEKTRGQRTSMSLVGFCNRLLLAAAVVFAGLAGFRYQSMAGRAAGQYDRRVGSGDHGVVANQIDLSMFEAAAPVQNRWGGRDIFGAPWESPREDASTSVPPAVDVPPAAVRGPELSSVIRLAGIVMDQSASQIIVEDLAQNQTVFLSEGQDILGARLVDISEDKAVFIYQNERVELTP
jgi:hypothetical protein